MGFYTNLVKCDAHIAMQWRCAVTDAIDPLHSHFCNSQNWVTDQKYKFIHRTQTRFIKSDAKKGKPRLYAK